MKPLPWAIGIAGFQLIPAMMLIPWSWDAFALCIIAGCVWGALTW